MAVFKFNTKKSDTSKVYVYKVKINITGSLLKNSNSVNTTTKKKTGRYVKLVQKKLNMFTILSFTKIREFRSKKKLQPLIV